MNANHPLSEFETGGARHNLVDGFVLGCFLFPLGGPDATTCFLCVPRFLLSRGLAAPVIGSSETVGLGRPHKFGFDLFGFEHHGSSNWAGRAGPVRVFAVARLGLVDLVNSENSKIEKFRNSRNSQSVLYRHRQCALIPKILKM